VSVTDAGGTYNGQPYPASATAVGLDGTTAVAGSFDYAFYAGAGTSGPSLGGTAPSSAGTYTVVATFTSADPNYAGRSAQATFTIAKAPLTVTANDATIIQGESPTITVRCSGLVNGKGPGILGGALTFAPTAPSALAPGTYALAPGGLTSGNYAIAFVSGTLTVLSYGQATNTLQSQVDAAGLDRGTRDKLDTQLQEAVAYFNAGDTADGVSRLGASTTSKLGRARRSVLIWPTPGSPTPSGLSPPRAETRRACRPGRHGAADTATPTVAGRLRAANQRAVNGARQRRRRAAAEAHRPVELPEPGRQHRLTGTVEPAAELNYPDDLLPRSVTRREAAGARLGAREKQAAGEVVPPSNPLTGPTAAGVDRCRRCNRP
jgi:hypothetical protein